MDCCPVPGRECPENLHFRFVGSPLRRNPTDLRSGIALVSLIPVTPIRERLSRRGGEGSQVVFSVLVTDESLGSL